MASQINKIASTNPSRKRVEGLGTARQAVIEAAVARQPQAAMVRQWLRLVGLTPATRLTPQRFLQKIAAAPPELLHVLDQGAFARQESASLARHLTPAQRADYQAGGLSFASALEILAATPAGYALAQEILRARAEAMHAFFAAWSQSLRETARANLKASIKSRQNASETQRVDFSRQDASLHQKKVSRKRQAMARKMPKWVMQQRATVNGVLAQLKLVDGLLGTTDHVAVGIDRLDGAPAPFSAADIVVKTATHHRPEPEAPKTPTGVDVQRKRSFSVA